MASKSKVMELLDEVVGVSNHMYVYFGWSGVVL